MASGCSSDSSPGGAIESFYRHMSAGEINAAWQMFSSDARAIAKNFGGKSVLAEKAKDMQKKGGIKDIQVQEEKEKGDMANVRVVIVWGNNEKEERSETLIKEDGVWRLAMKK